MPNADSRKNYRFGSLLSVTTAVLLATQEPFSSLAAKRLTFAQFVFLTQMTLLLSSSFILFRSPSRRDLIIILSTSSNYKYLFTLFIIGIAGLFLYKLGLSNAHPIIISAILNLSPFWAAVVALIIARIPIPVSARIFFSCLAAAFIGAMVVAWSQLGDGNRLSLSDLGGNILHGSWIYALPVPLLSALSATLVGKWFAKYDTSAAIASNFIVSSCVIIPVALIVMYSNAELYSDQFIAIGLMVTGTVSAAALGRLMYQFSLSATGNDNGFVSMFFLLVPALTSLISLPLSWWIPDLRFVAGPAFFLGLSLIAASLLLFSLKAWR
jgi:drug/metabolite transporter (DMT)-like permease